MQKRHFLGRLSLLLLSIAILISSLMRALFPPQRNQPPLCRVVEIVYQADNWRIARDIVISPDSHYVLRLFSATPPYAERRSFAGRLQPDTTSCLVQSISTNACWEEGDLSLCLLRSISTNACWETTNRVPSYVYCARNTKVRDP